jgi:hypothetical protein
VAEERSGQFGTFVLPKRRVLRGLFQHTHPVPQGGDSIRGQAVSVEVVFEIRLVDESGDCAVQYQADSAVPVLASLEALVEASDGA